MHDVACCVKPIKTSGRSVGWQSFLGPHFCGNLVHFAQFFENAISWQFSQIINSKDFLYILIHSDIKWQILF